MATLMIGYDLNRQKDYATLIDAIKKLGPWWHCLDSTWIVVCNHTPAAIRDHLQRFMDTDDELLVIDVTGRARAWTGFNADCSKWLHESYQ